MDRGAEPFSNYGPRDLPLHYAVRNGKVYAIPARLSKDADKQLRANASMYPSIETEDATCLAVRLAAKPGANASTLEVVEELLAAGGNINTFNRVDENDLPQSLWASSKLARATWSRGFRPASVTAVQIAMASQREDLKQLIRKYKYPDGSRPAKMVPR